MTNLQNTAALITQAALPPVGIGYTLGKIALKNPECIGKALLFGPLAAPAIGVELGKATAEQAKEAYREIKEFAKENPETINSMTKVGIGLLKTTLFQPLATVSTLLSKIFD